MTYFLKSGDTYRVASEEAMDMTEKLPVGTYMANENQFFKFLQKVNDFTFSGKRYGENITMTDRIYSTFKDREGSTGVLLSGEKGSGKSLLAKTLAMTAAQDGIPTVLVNSPFHDDEFKVLISGINQPAVIIFDEFEKVYKEDNHQNQILSLLDGMFNSKKLFILTVNNMWKVSDFMLNRPSRLFYHIKFKGLSEEFVREYCEDNLLDKEKIAEIISVSRAVENFNFDMIQALVQEMNRYKESAAAALKFLNIDMQAVSNSYTLVEFSPPTGEKLSKLSTDREVKINLNDPSSHFYLSYFVKIPAKNKDDDDGYKSMIFYTKDLASFDSETGVYVLKNKANGAWCKIQRIEHEAFNIFNHIF